MPRCTEKTLAPGKKWLHRWNRAGVCLDCGAVSHRAVRIKKLTAEWTCPNCGNEIEWTEQIVDQQKREPRPGDNFICVECSAVSVVTPDNLLRPMTEAELLGRRPASQKIIRNARAGTTTLSVPQGRAFAVSAFTGLAWSPTHCPLQPGVEPDATSKCIAGEQTDDSDFPVVMNLDPVRDGGVLQFGRVRKAAPFLAQGLAAGVVVTEDRLCDIAASGRREQSIRGWLFDAATVD